jgi:hypothetical protein
MGSTQNRERRRQNEQGLTNERGREQANEGEGRQTRVAVDGVSAERSLQMWNGWELTNERGQGRRQVNGGNECI